MCSCMGNRTCTHSQVTVGPLSWLSTSWMHLVGSCSQTKLQFILWPWKTVHRKNYIILQLPVWSWQLKVGLLHALHTNSLIILTLVLVTLEHSAGDCNGVLPHSNQCHIPTSPQVILTPAMIHIQSSLLLSVRAQYNYVRICTVDNLWNVALHVSANLEVAMYLLCFSLCNKQVLSIRVPVGIQ